MKTGASMVDRFTEMAKDYDEHNRRLASISDNLHFLIRLVLKELPARARVLCVGVGTGAEILALSEVFPEWTFVGVDPSGGMLEVCRHRLGEAGILDRCELVEGYVQDVPVEEHHPRIPVLPGGPRLLAFPRIPGGQGVPGRRLRDRPDRRGGRRVKAKESRRDGRFPRRRGGGAACPT